MLGFRREFEDEIRQIYPETTQVRWITVDTVGVIKTANPVSWNLAQAEWIDNALQEGYLLRYIVVKLIIVSTQIEEWLQELQMHQ